LPGDWDLKGLEVTESVEAKGPAPEEEEEEVDYDEAKEVLNDD
jgi:hypothetical protein